MYMQLIETSGMTLGISDISDYNILCNWGLRDKNQNVLMTYVLGWTLVI